MFNQRREKKKNKKSEASLRDLLVPSSRATCILGGQEGEREREGARDIDI